MRRWALVSGRTQTMIRSADAGWEASSSRTAASSTSSATSRRASSLKAVRLLLWKKLAREVSILPGG